MRVRLIDVSTTLARLPNLFALYLFFIRIHRQYRYSASPLLGGLPVPSTLTRLYLNNMFVDIDELQQYLLLFSNLGELWLGNDLRSAVLGCDQVTGALQLDDFDKDFNLRNAEAKSLSEVRLDTVVVGSHHRKQCSLIVDLARRTPVLSELVYLELNFIREAEGPLIKQVIEKCGPPIRFLALDFYETNLSKCLN